MKNENILKIRETLLSFGQAVKSEKLFQVLIPGAAELILSEPYAFSFAACLDRGTKAQIIWTIPYDIKIFMGHFDSRRFGVDPVIHFRGVTKRLVLRASVSVPLRFPLPPISGNSC